MYPEVTPDQKALFQRLLTKTNMTSHAMLGRMTVNIAHSDHILEDSVEDPQTPTMTAFTPNSNHTLLVVVEEQCVYCVNYDDSCQAEIPWQAWVSSCLFVISRGVQEFGLVCFRSKATKTMKGFESILVKLFDEASPKTLVKTAIEANEKEKETVQTSTEQGKDLAPGVTTKQQQQKIMEPAACVAQPSLPFPHCT